MAAPSNVELEAQYELSLSESTKLVASLALTLPAFKEHADAVEAANERGAHGQVTKSY